MANQLLNVAGYFLRITHRAYFVPCVRTEPFEYAFGLF